MNFWYLIKAAAAADIKNSTLKKQSIEKELQDTQLLELRNKDFKINIIKYIQDSTQQDGKFYQ